MGASSAIVVKSLREQVYDYLRNQLKLGTLTPSVYLDLNAMAESMGVSRTPLRDALLQLEAEDFVTFVPRKGVMVNPLERRDIQEIYQLVGALESRALLAAAPKLDKGHFAILRELDAGSLAALEAGELEQHYEHNLAFHDLFLEVCGNQRIRKTVQLQKQRLYEWIRKMDFNLAWEHRNVREHEVILDLLEQGQVAEAAAYLRDTHWGYEIQENFVDDFYFKKG